MASAIVVGATGILGREIVKEMGKEPGKWKTVHALSRSQKDEYPSNVVHDYIDLMNSAKDMANNLKDVKADYVFFAAYFQQESEDKEWEVNGNMLSNFLEALDLTGAAPNIKRIILVTGAKQYGVHLGQPKNPMIETDPWLRDSKHPHLLLRETPNTSWVVTYPNDVIGFAKGNYMNLASSIGIYAAVTKELGQDLIWPGSETFYTKFDSFTDSKLHAKFSLWAAQEPKAANQAFNVVNGDVQSWQDLWPRVARRFGMVVKPDQFAGESELANTTVLPAPAPITLVAREIGLEGKIGRSEMAQRVNLERWSRTEEVKRAWERLAQREGLEGGAFGKATWGFLDFILGRNYDLVIGMGKAREMGWDGYKDTWKSFSDVFGELEAARVLPKVHRV
ncbi:nad dependent epimerase dehydratase [Podospora aff. communis PSN243]|uniref:Nad dependent epimerase dehydratase n=1 Tax=Podospora aff. communis PSN243 TaxID=3040156 RepID=A0AAV9H418_9PEZI|nr:nad dependent epimerase dehydratase [Podospora aff. communis PSN243]